MIINWYYEINVFEIIVEDGYDVEWNIFDFIFRIFINFFVVVFFILMNLVGGFLFLSLMVVLIKLWFDMFLGNYIGWGVRYFFVVVLINVKWEISCVVSVRCIVFIVLNMIRME